MSRVSGQYIIDPKVDEDDTDIELVDFQVVEGDLPLYLSLTSSEYELEKAHVKNVREKLALYMELIDGDTITDYHYPRRTKFEVNGAYKIAKRRQKRHIHIVRDVKVFNLFFRFKNSRTNALRTSAMMYRPTGKREEWVLLLPNDTAALLTDEIDRSLFYAYSIQLVETGAYRCRTFLSNSLWEKTDMA
ncbi:hypothetical protein AN963_24765 [Brevibacillus choshinensis]|uniref:Uncharacterized protein n=1 Tax=Brevibacillus choshinensis TaxID=54911 RepID=A0ABR5N2W9_BRECH|nr:hypothetical protein [Brevibacillus choshinensis]KQL44596.1 hypothetical protein AN963_24765 [Brevibacillus choshinensis]